MRFFRHPVGIAWALLLSIPFFFLWNWLAPIYLPSLPPLYLHLPFFHCVGIFILVAIVRIMVLPL